MTRSDIIKKYSATFIENRDTEFDVEARIIALVILCQMKRIENLGLLTDGGTKFTVNGFDLVKDILDDGWELEEEEIIEFLLGMKLIEKEKEAPTIAKFIIHLQAVGYEKFQEDISEFKNSNFYS